MNAHHPYVVSEYMHPQVPTVLAGTTLKEILRRMLKAHEHWVVVLDDKGGVAGVISSLDIVKHIVPDYMEKDVHIAHFASKHNFSDRINELGNDPVEKFMTAKVQTVKPSDSLMTAAAIMVDYRVHRLPVVDEEGTLVGYIGQTAMANAMVDVFFS